MYTALTLDEQSRSILQSAFPCVGSFQSETQSGTPLPHHMTINMGMFDESLNPKHQIGNIYLIEVDGLLYDQRIAAARVVKAVDVIHGEPITTRNRFPHITMGLAIGQNVRPVESNVLCQKAHDVAIPLGETRLVDYNLIHFVFPHKRTSVIISGVLQQID